MPKLWIMPSRLRLAGYILIGLTAVAHAEGASSSAYLPAVLSGILGFVGSLIGANFALRNFKRQRTFDKQLDWYERAARAVYTLAERIEIACTFQDEYDEDYGEAEGEAEEEVDEEADEEVEGEAEEEVDEEADEEARKKAEANLEKLWTDVQTAHLRVGRVAHESRFFGTAEAITRMDMISHHVDEVAGLSATFDPPKIKEEERENALKEVFELIEWLNEACRPLIAEGVTHLGLDSRQSRWKLWTDKITGTVLPYWNRITGRTEQAEAMRAGQKNPDTD
jgi:hypothetical protein